MSKYGKLKVAEIKELLGWNTTQWNRFLRESSIVGKDLINTDKFWNGVPRPEVLLWGTVPLVVQERMLEEINKKLVNDRAVADLELLQYRYEPIIFDAAEKSQPSQPAESPEVGSSSPVDPPRPSGFWDPVAEAWRGG